MNKYYGSETKKAVNNFDITGITVSLEFIHATTVVKKAAIQTNLELGTLQPEKAKAMLTVCDEILNKQHDAQFVTDQIQGGAGTAINMNLNEVIALRATEILRNVAVHPNDDANKSQSTNDIIPTALRLFILQSIDVYVKELELLRKVFEEKSKNFSSVLKVGRTHLQDAVPMTLGQEFGAYAAFIKRDIERFESAKVTLLETNLGGTAIGTGITSTIKYIKLVNEVLSKLSGYAFVAAADLIDSTQNTDVFANIAGTVNTSANGLTKICNDLRLLTSGPNAGFNEIYIPEVQKGSSIMPGKVNPVILECMNQICFQVQGNAVTMQLATQNGQLELNTFLPVYVKNCAEAFKILTAGIKMLRERCVLGITANEAQCNRSLENSYATATALTGALGYDKVDEIVRNVVKNGTTLKKELENSELTNEQVTELLSSKKLTQPE